MLIEFDDLYEISFATGKSIDYFQMSRWSKEEQI